MKKTKSNQNEMSRSNPTSKTSTKKKIKQWWQNYRWWVMAVGVVAVFILGFIGFPKAHQNLSFPDVLYRIFQLFVLDFNTAQSNMNGWLEAARWLAPLIAAYTAISALTTILSEQFHVFRARFLRNHIIICGLGSKGLQLVQKFKNYGEKVAVIEIDKENDNIRECKDIGAVVLIGNAMAPYILLKAGLSRAKHLFALGGQDGINAEIAIQSRKLVTGKKRKPLTCTIHISDTQLSRLIKEKEFETEKNDAFRLEFFNFFDQAAQFMIETYPPFSDKEILQTSSPHLLIVGAGRMGESLLVHTAKKWRNFPGRKGKKINISFIDKAANQKQKLFYLRCPGLYEICQLNPLEMDIKSPDFEAGHFLFDQNGNCTLTIIYICIDDDSFAVSTALIMHQHLKKHIIPIVVQINSESGLADLVQGESFGLRRLQCFGLLDRVLKPEALLMGTHETLARAIHSEYIKTQSEKGDTLQNNPTLVPWDQLPATLKESNRRQADFLGVKLKSIGCYVIPMIDWNVKPVEFTPEEIELMARMEHDHWMEERLKDDWEFKPGQKNIQKKMHNSLVSWGQLKEEEKEKDRDAVRNIPGYLEKAGFQIYRRID